ncbi:MAG TPA: translation initiation factor IF-2 N-terminal domain-containing protein, partial [Tenuifilaceae bacterium]|nr:translation initiation factor IF-2 N-terminal domain-containing protein [Tenuifilaceae bacterium]
MTNDKSIRISKLAREFNVGVSTLVEFLKKKGYHVTPDPNAKVDEDIVNLLTKEFGAEVNIKKESQKVSLKSLRDAKETLSIDEIEKKRDEDEGDSDFSNDEVIIKTSGFVHEKID